MSNKIHIVIVTGVTERNDVRREMEIGVRAAIGNTRAEMRWGSPEGGEGDRCLLPGGSACPMKAGMWQNLDSRREVGMEVWEEVAHISWQPGLGLWLIL
jgi:hydrogenase maturation factor